MKIQRFLFGLMVTVAAVMIGGAFPAPSSAQEDDDNQLFIGFSYLRFNGSDEGFISGRNLIGLTGEFTYAVSGKWGIAGEISAQAGDPQVFSDIGTDVSASFSIATISAGPRYWFYRRGDLAASVIGLVGTARGNIDPEFVGVPIENLRLNQRTFSASIGVTLDWRLTRQVGFRVAQPQILITDLGDATQANLRFSTGLLVYF